MLTFKNILIYSCLPDSLFPTPYSEAPKLGISPALEAPLLWKLPCSPCSGHQGFDITPLGGRAEFTLMEKNSAR
uniref:Uncharacterized protein n=1 Tax=Moorena producens (strain JHB) TaxID=1454205 RepID=A0A1D9G0E2_MOOP1